jgi:hypothetical protein
VALLALVCAASPSQRSAPKTDANLTRNRWRRAGTSSSIERPQASRYMVDDGTVCFGCEPASTGAGSGTTPAILRAVRRRRGLPSHADDFSYLSGLGNCVPPYWYGKATAERLPFQATGWLANAIPGAANPTLSTLDASIAAVEHAKVGQGWHREATMDVTNDCEAWGLNATRRRFRRTRSAWPVTEAHRCEDLRT